MTKNNTRLLEEKIEANLFVLEKYNYIDTIKKYAIIYLQIYSWVRNYVKSGPEGLILIVSRIK